MSLKWIFPHILCNRIKYALNDIKEGGRIGNQLNIENVQGAKDHFLSEYLSKKNWHKLPHVGSTLFKRSPRY